MSVAALGFLVVDGVAVALDDVAAVVVFVGIIRIRRSENIIVYCGSRVNTIN
jgi:energy-converting hydrogenase Eha subunit C